jgi:hypothetical protein
MTTSTLDARQAEPGPSVVAPWATAVLVGATLVAAMALTHPIVAIDDAFISYRYAANLAQSGQLVFNLGERVEGATNLLWILVLAGLRRATGLPIERLAIGADLVLVGFAVARCQMLLRWIGLGLRDSCLAVVATFGLADVVLAMTNGLEAALYAALLSEALVALRLRRPAVLGLLVGLLFMTRPEGALMGGLLLLCLALGAPRAGPLLRAAVPALVVIGATTVWRWFYFDALVPNSIVAKSFPLAALPGVLRTMSLPYLGAFLGQDSTLAATLAGAVAMTALALMRGATARRSGIAGLWLAATLIPLASVAITARNGGDWMPHFRLLTQYAPCYVLALGLLARSWPGRSWLALLAITAVALWPTARAALTRPCCGFDIRAEPPAGVFTEAAERLAPILRDGDVVSAEAAGLLPFRLLTTRVHDPVGLMDPYIARHGTPTIPYGKTDIPYTFDVVRPTFMVWHWAGHIFQASQAARSRYAAFCWARCDQRDEAAVVLVRRDRMDKAVEDAFRTWSPWPLVDAASAGPTHDSPP